MSVNSLTTSSNRFSRLRWRSWVVALGLSVWVFGGFFASQAIVVAMILGLRQIGVDFTAVNKAFLSFVLAAIIYLLTIGIVIGLPWVVKRTRTTLEEIGLTRLPDWRDILLAPAGFVVYLLVSSILVHLVQQLFPYFNVAQSQDTGFSNLSNRYEYIFAFITLVVIAPVAEEILMRGYLYGKLRQFIPVIAAGLMTSVVFGILHGQLNVGVDVFALSLVLCSLREVTGSIWAGILLHMMKNGLAFYLLFINTSFLHTIGG
jgi:membrane protease YdiL (CAAX protease family)